jgi:uncharacterized protein
MAKDDGLNEPLHGAVRERPPRRPPLIAPLLVVTASLLAVTAALWVAIVDDPDGGRAVAVAAIENAVPTATGSLPVSAGAAAGSKAGDASAEVELAALPVVPLLGADPGLAEQSPFGLLPRVSPDGRRPRDVYARATPKIPQDAPRIAIIIGGLGISQSGTQRAIEQLPEDVTLAFAPYGASLRRWGSKARAEGHEILLQVPLEPDGYPAESPGEHTLLASAPEDMRQDLYWVLSRLTGYAGVMNYMGARFTSDERALVPFLGEIGGRGLFYVDDGSSRDSRAQTVGEGLRVPVLTADRVIDRERSPSGMMGALTELEAIATTRGYAVGVATAFPSTVDAIALWVTQAQERGIAVVPVSAALAH